jgi:CRP-like cAMP-binding protein
MSKVFKGLFADSRLFRGLPDRVVDELAKAAVRREYGKGEMIFSQGDEGDSLYCVVSGRVRIDAIGLEGQEVFLNEMRPGDCFGELELLDGFPRTAGARATERSALLAIHRSFFLRLLNEERQLSAHCLALFCERMRWTISLYEDAAFLTSAARLAKRLLHLTTGPGGQADETLELEISQADLARFLGTSRKSVNRHLRDWKGRGWIAVARARLCIRDPHALRRLATGQDNGCEPPR